MDSKTEQFLNKYKELEALAEAKYNLPDTASPIAVLMRKPEYRQIRSELDCCREIRNLLSHNPKFRDSYPVEPSDAMLAVLDRTIDHLRNPQRAKHVMVPRSRVLCKTENDPVLPALQQMNEHLYSHIPILKNGVVVGVFSESTLLAWLLKEGTLRIDRKVRFSDIADCLPIHRHRAESFRFISQNMLTSEIEELFERAIKQRQRIGLLLVTATGKPTERLLGIISAWDAAAIE